MKFHDISVRASIVELHNLAPFCLLLLTILVLIYIINI